MLYSFLGLGLGLGVILICLVVLLAYYVFFSLAHMKALKALGYDKAWLAWIPYACYFACADAVCGDEENVMLFHKFSIPAMLFKLWWILPIMVVWLPINEGLTNIISRVISIVFLGWNYAVMYARLENKTEQETQVLGCLSGFLPIIAACKFIGIK